MYGSITRNAGSPGQTGTTGCIPWEPSTMRLALVMGGKLKMFTLKTAPPDHFQGHAERVSIFITRLIRRK